METGPLTYAVGDIHGCAELLDALLGRIAAHAGGRAHRLVFLGDLIDRGPDSAGVLRAVSRLHVLDGDHDFGRHVVHGHNPTPGRPAGGARLPHQPRHRGRPRRRPHRGGLFSERQGPALDFLAVRAG